MGTVAKRTNLRANGHTATQGKHLYIFLCPSQLPKGLGHLVCQLPGRTQHQRLYRELLRLQLFDQRYSEGRGLAAAGLGHGNHIPARHGRRHGFYLNTGWLRVIQPVKVGLHGRRQAQLFERRHKKSVR